jgi:hypothetical protein
MGLPQPLQLTTKNQSPFFTFSGRINRDTRPFGILICGMTKPAPKVDDEPGAQERFDRAIKNALATPPKPHKAASEKPKPKR